MTHLLYIEINVVCILLLGIIFFKQFNNRSIVSSSQIFMKRLIVTSCVLCVSDALAMIFRGQTFNGARVLIQASNLVYLESMPLISMFWLKYVYARIGKKIHTMQNLLLSLPLLLYSIVAISNPFTRILFGINSENLYVRGPGVFLHWIVSWVYLFVAGIVSFKAYKTAQTWAQRNERRALLIFIILPTICCILQMLIYGITVVQVGIALSIVLVNFQLLDNRISIDELTGINNRKEMNTYVERVLSRYKSISLNVVMIDVNKFKLINDTFGHNIGDEALKYVATALKNVCEKIGDQLFLCRYGGDEFVIISKDNTEKFSENLKILAKNELESISTNDCLPYELSISIGNAIETCECMADFKKCIVKADKAMYLEKEKLKKKL